MFKIPEWGEDVPKNNVNLKVFPRGLKRLKQTKFQNTSDFQKAKFKTKNKQEMKAFVKKNIDIKANNINQNKDIKLADFKGIKNPQVNNHVKVTKGKTVNSKKKRKPDSHSRKIQNYDSDAMDEIIINNNKNKLIAKYQNEDNEESLFNNSNNSKGNNKKRKLQKLNGLDSKVKKLNDSNKVESISSNNMSKEALRKMRLKELLQKESHRNPVFTTTSTSTGENKLRDRMMERLNAAKFRYLNEKLYTSSGSDAQQLFQSDPSAFQTYHQGYQQQLKKWPVNPLDVVVKRIQNMPKTHVIADMGCGEAALSSRVPHTVRSFDLVANAPNVEVCDMAHTPLLSDSLNVAVYCLALMGTDLTQYLVEANRVLKTGGHLLIAEVESRFNNVDAFTRDVQKLGFTLKKIDKTHKVFFFMEFTKVREAPVKKSKLPMLSLKPCIYKRR